MPDRSAPFRSEIIPAHQVKINPVVCPRCGGNDLMLFGQMSFPHHEVMEAGVITSKETDWNVKENFELLAIDCLRCEVRYHIQSDENFLLAKTNAELHDKVHVLSGRGNRPC
jgi:hypothetical protein